MFLLKEMLRFSLKSAFVGFRYLLLDELLKVFIKYRRLNLLSWQTLNFLLLATSSLSFLAAATKSSLRSFVYYFNVVKTKKKLTLDPKKAFSLFWLKKIRKIKF